MQHLKGLAEVLGFTPTFLVRRLGAYFHEILRHFVGVAANNLAITDTQAPKTVDTLPARAYTKHLVRFVHLLRRCWSNDDAFGNSKVFQHLLTSSVGLSSSTPHAAQLVLSHFQAVLMFGGCCKVTQQFGRASPVRGWAGAWPAVWGSTDCAAASSSAWA